MNTGVKNVHISEQGCLGLQMALSYMYVHVVF